MDGFMSLTVKSEIETMPGSTTAVRDTVNIEDAGSNPALAANTEDWNEVEGILTLERFRPVIPVEVSIGIKASRDPIERQKLKKIFLDVLRSTASVVDAANICKIPKSLAFAWRSNDPEFGYLWDQIIKTETLPKLEAEAIRRALNGSDLMLIFMLKALDREKYDDKVAEKNTVHKPNIMIQIRDVDKSLIAIASSNSVPGIDYETGKQLDGKKDITTPVDAEYTESGPSNGPVTSTEGVGKK